MNKITLTKQQEQAMDMIKTFLDDRESQVFILKGYAGTGKTTLISEVVDYLNDIQRNAALMAPTGRAAKVLRTKLNTPQASTIHRGIYNFERLEMNEEDGTMKFIFPLVDNTEPGLYIVDEASMVSSRKSNQELFQFGTGVLMDDLLTFCRLNYGGKIIFVGDPMQLPPVGDNRSCALDDEYFKELGLHVASYELTDVIRQGQDSIILKNATMLRDLGKSKERNRLVFEQKEGEVEMLSPLTLPDLYCQTDDMTSAIICYANAQAADYNAEIRRILYPGATHVMPGDRLMVVNNCYRGETEFYNGDFVTVTEVDPNVVTQSAPVWTEKNGAKCQVTVSLDFRKVTIQTEDGKFEEHYIIDTLLNNKKPNLTIDEMKAMYINLVMRAREELNIKNIHSEEFKNLSMGDEFYNALQVKYGYAFTCHKSQGGEWDTAYVDFAGRTGLDNDSLRWKYTAVTRAKQRLICMNYLPITPLSKLRINPVIKTSKVSKDAVSYARVEDTPYHGANALMGQRAKYWSVVGNMEDTPYRVEKVICGSWRDSYEVSTPQGAVRVDALYNGGGKFTRYQCQGGSMDDSLLACFTNEDNISYSYAYDSSYDSLRSLHAQMCALCDELGIKITNITTPSYQVVYYLKCSGEMAVLQFYYSDKGYINYAAPLSDLGAEDSKLNLLIEKLREQCQ